MTDLPPAAPSADDAPAPASANPVPPLPEPLPEPLAEALPEPAPEAVAEPESPAAAGVAVEASGLEAVAEAPATETPADEALATETSTTAPPADLGPAACAAELAARFPALFGAGRALPIKLRVQTDIQLRAPGVFSRKSLSLFLHRYTTSTAYLKALVSAPSRFDLDGVAAGEVAEEHRAAAVGEVDRRRAIVDARRAAEREAQREAQRLAGAARRQQGRGPASQGEDAGSVAQHPTAQAPQAFQPQPSRQPRPPRPQPDRPAQTRGPQAQPRPPRQGPGPGQAGRPDRPPGPAPIPEPALAAPPDPQDDAHRERAALLRTYESSTLTRANFCALKRMSESELETLLSQARQEREQRAQAQPRPPQAGAGPHRGPRPQSDARPPRAGPPRRG